jgi:hypothetical protein
VLFLPDPSRRSPHDTESSSGSATARYRRLLRRGTRPSVVLGRPSCAVRCCNRRSLPRQRSVVHTAVVASVHRVKAPSNTTIAVRTYKNDIYRRTSSKYVARFIAPALHRCPFRPPLESKWSPTDLLFPVRLFLPKRTGCCSRRCLRRYCDHVLRGGKRFSPFVVFRQTNIAYIIVCVIVISYVSRCVQLPVSQYTYTHRRGTMGLNQGEVGLGGYNPRPRKSKETTMCYLNNGQRVKSTFLSIHFSTILQYTNILNIF